MEKLFAPAVALMNRMGYSRKFAIMGVLALVAISVLTYSLYNSLNTVVRTSQKELAGIEAIKPMPHLVQHLQQHRGMSAGFLNGDETMRSRRATQEQEVTAAFKAVEAKLSSSLRETDAWEKIRTAWEDIAKNGLAVPSTIDAATAANFGAHTKLINNVLIFQSMVADQYALTNDPDIDSLYLVDTTMNKLPLALERLGQLQTLGLSALAKKRVLQKESIAMRGFINDLNAAVASLRVNLNKTASYNPEMKLVLDQAAQEVEDVSSEVTKVVIEDIFIGTFNMSPAQYFEMATTSIDKANKQMFDTFLPALEQLVQRRIDNAQRNLIINLSVVALMLLIFVYVSIGMYYATINSINNLSNNAHALATGDLSVRIDLGTRDELSLVGDSFNHMADSLGSLIGKIQESSQQLKQKTADIQAMMHYIPQGILTVMEGRKVHPEFSAYLETILETKDIAGRDLMELVFADSNLNVEILSQVETALSACIGEDAMNFEFNSHVLVSEVEKKMPNGQVKILDLSWSPITDDADTVVRLMLCVRDVTELKALAAAAGQQKRDLDIIGQILAISQEKFAGFVEGSMEFLVENKRIIDAVGSTPSGALDPETVTQLFRNMHTIKGNARTYGLLHLTNMVHEAEQAYDELRKNPDAVWDQEKLLGELAGASAAIEEYAHINRVKLGRAGPGRRAGVEKYLMVQKVDIQDALDLMDEAVRSNDPVQLRTAYQRVQKMLELLGTVRIKDALEGVVDSLPSLAKELSKEPPEITIDDRNIVLRTQVADLLKNVFMHLYRNSMDHGIESPAARVAKGKKPAGHIRLELTLVDDRFLLTLRDDGRGLAVGRIKQKALDNGLITAGQELSAQETAQLIFLPGFSTAEAVTEVSGRGVGMDAVQSFVKREEGLIELRLLSSASADGYCPFETVIDLPAKLAVQG